MRRPSPLPVLDISLAKPFMQPSASASPPPDRCTPPPHPTPPHRLVKIARVLGTDSLYAYLDKYGLELDSQVGGEGPCPCAVAVLP